jgi:chemotaxis signal transduction protein
MSGMDDAAIFHDIVSLKTDLTNLRYDMISRKDEIKFVMASQDPNLLPLKKVWVETMQLAMRAAQIFEGSSTDLERSMSTLGSLVNGLKSAMQRTQALSKSAGKVLERSFIVIFDLAGKVYCFHVDAVQEIIAPKQFLTLPKMPYFMKGVMEHRNCIIPIVDPALILRVNHRSNKQRLILVMKNGDTVALLVDNVRQVAPVLSGYFRQPKRDEPLLQMVYEDGTTKIDMLDPKLMLEVGMRRAFNYSRQINGAAVKTVLASRSTQPVTLTSGSFPTLRTDNSTTLPRHAA